MAGGIESRAHQFRRRGERVAEDARPSEEREAHPTATQLLAEELDRTLGGVEPIGVRVAHRHALRDVERDDRIERRCCRPARDLADLWPDERDHDEKAGGAHEDHLRELSRGTRRRKPRARAGEGGESAAPPDERDRAQRDDQDRRDQ